MPKTRLISPGSIPNHKLLKNLQTQGNYISKDGDDEGLSIGSSGQVIASSSLYFYDLGGEYISGDGTDLDIFSGRNVDVTAGGNFSMIGGANSTPITMAGSTKTASTAFDSTMLFLETLNLGGGEAGGSDVHYGLRYLQIQTDTSGWDSVYLMYLTGGTAAKTFAVQGDGKVGIGVTDPDSLLEIFGTSAQLKLSYDASNHAAITVADDGHLELATTGTDADLTLNAESNIILDADGDNITMKAGSTGSGLDFIQSGTGDYTIKNLTSDKDIIFNVNDDGADTEVMRLDGSASSLFIASSKNIEFGNVGEYIYGNGTNMFIKSSGVLNIDATGNIHIDSSASVILDSATGAFVMNGAGATPEFSVANSAYAGMILAYRLIGEDVAHASYTLTNAFVVPDSDMTVRFIAPPSGNVEVMVQVMCNMTSSNRIFYFGLSDNATYNTIGVEYEQLAYAGDETDDNIVQHYWGITGLVAGDTYNYFFGAKISATVGYLNWGGDGSGRYCDFIMKVTALPAATADFAVYD